MHHRSALSESRVSTGFYCNSSRLPSGMLKKQSQFWNIGKLFRFSLVTDYVKWHFGLEFFCFWLFDGGYCRQDTCLSQVTSHFPFEMLWCWKPGCRFREKHAAVIKPVFLTRMTLDWVYYQTEVCQAGPWSKSGRAELSLVAARAPLNFLGTGQRPTELQVLPIKMTEELAKNQLQLVF